MSVRALSLAALLLVLPGSAAAVDVGAQVWAIGSTPSKRFPDAESAGPTFDKDARLVVLVVEGERARVLGPDNRFGWVALAALTETEPVTPGLENLLQEAGMEPSAPVPASASPQ